MGKITLFHKNALKSVFFFQMFLIIDSLGPGHYPRVNIKDFLKSGHMPFFPCGIHIYMYINIYTYIFEDHTGKRAYVHFSKNPRYGPWGNALVLNYLL